MEKQRIAASRLVSLKTTAIRRPMRENMLGAGASGNLSGNESGIDVKNGNDTIAMEVRPLKLANGKRRKKRNSQQTFA